MKVNKLRYLGFYLGTTVVLTILSIVLNALLNLSVGSGTATAVIPLISAMLEGQWIGKTLDHEPTSGEKWSAAFVMTLVCFAANVVLTVAVFMTLPDPRLLTLPLWGWIAIFLFLHMLVFLMSRFGLGMGLKNAKKLTA